MTKTADRFSDEKIEFPLHDYDGYKLKNSAGLHYEADHVFECIQEGMFYILLFNSF
jgi:hypothetical protein